MIAPIGYRTRLGMVASRAVSIAGLVMAMAAFGLESNSHRNTAAPAAESVSSAGYVGSRACAKCHPSIYESFSRTDMGHSMSEITPALLDRIPTSASIFDAKLNRHFELYARDGALFQSEFATTGSGKDIFNETHKLEWIIGSGANGSGAIVKQGEYLFEAPLSYYAKPNRWALSPGYEFGDYGFNRPILPGCIVCHSGQPRPVLNGNGRFLEPAFSELAIGCENCHGPGEAHIAAAQVGLTPGSITNPAKLSLWLADNICMSCHQTGDARVLQAGKTYRDFLPGTELDTTLSIFLVPFSRESAPKDDLLEHYLSMRLSKCYRNGGGKLACISCHDPHMQPSAEQAAAYFRQKCMACHIEKSCAVPLTLRQRKNPPDDCAGCHMPKRNVTVISHSVLTNHRIIAEAEEPFPDAAFHMATPQLPDLIHLNASKTRPDAPSPLTLLEAYSQVMLSHPEYRSRYWAIAKELENSHPHSVLVMEALADWALQNKSADRSALAIRYLKSAILHGATNPADFEQLATLLIAANRESDALRVLQQGAQLVPYHAELYRLMARLQFSANRTQEACEVVVKGLEKFSQDAAMQDLAKKCVPVLPARSD
jgi:hypothetical protein